MGSTAARPWLSLQRLGERNKEEIHAGICHFIAISLKMGRPYSPRTDHEPLKYTRRISDRQGFAHLAELPQEQLWPVCDKGRQKGPTKASISGLEETHAFTRSECVRA